MLYAGLAIVVGALTSIQARANGALSVRLGNNFASALYSQFAAWIFLLIIVFGFSKNRSAVRKAFQSVKNKEIKYWEVAGGFIGGSFLCIQSYAVPLIGVALFTIGIVAGQTASSLLIDKWGWGPSGKKAVTGVRVFSASLTIFAVALSVFPDLRKSSVSGLPIILTLLIGCTLALQQALNGRMVNYLKEPVGTTFLNFINGTLVMVVGLVISLLKGGSIKPVPTNIWLYIGGPCGLIFIMVSAVIIKHLGVLSYILYTVFGSLIGAVLIDWLAPAHKGALSSYLIVGTVITLTATAYLKLREGKTSAA